ncbi:MAG: 3' terminal RNA ribose 2'-O-methyltransferase Hen1 [Sporichthyaceae bacterium]
MLLTLSTTMPQADDLGYLVHKHPDKAQTFETASGTAHVFWPESTPERATVALLLEVDPIALVRGKGRRDQAFALAQYVNDRPYAASSMLAVALGKVFRTAMSGRCDARPDLVTRPLPLEVHLPALPSHPRATRASEGRVRSVSEQSACGADLVERLFTPLGWTVTATSIPLDPDIPRWGDSHYVDAHLSGNMVLADALSHLYVLIPVLDNSKHYWVSTDEVDKLLRTAGPWLGEHPERELITRRYLGNHRELVQDAVGRLTELDDTESAHTSDEAAETDDERPTPLAQLRAEAVLAALHAEGARTVVDLGCGDGKLLRVLMADPRFTTIVGVDVSHRALEIATRRMHLERMPDSQRARVEMLQSSATYRDDRLAGHDALVLMEVIEHIDLPRLPALVRSVFGHARPISVVVTTPNVEHNVRFEFLPAGAMRHGDHRFEWTRDEFRAWADTVAADHGYAVRFLPVGADDAEVGPPTQMAVFRRPS